MKIQLFSMHLSNDLLKENLGIERIKAFLVDRGYAVTTTYLPMDDTMSVDEIIEDCNLYGFSIFGYNMDVAYKYAQYIKKMSPKSYVFVGSKYVSLNFSFILEEYELFDFAVLGDGEFTLLDLIERMQKSTLLSDIAKEHPHIATKDSNMNKSVFNSNICDLPLPSRDYINTRATVAVNLCDSHGCTRRCSFCGLSFDNSAWSGRDMNDIFDELQMLYYEKGIRVVMFTSGSIEDHGKEQLAYLSDKIICSGMKLGMQCYIRADSFDEKDQELLNKMHNAGFVFFRVGLESGNREDLALYGKSSSVSKNENIIQVLEREKVKIYYEIIMLNPYSNMRRLSDNMKFLDKYRCSTFNHYVSFLAIYYNTPIYRKLVKENLLLPTYNYKNIAAYKFIDSSVNEIFKFISDTFLKNHELFTLHDEYNSFIQFCYLICELVDIKDIEYEIKKTQDALFLLCKEYFSQLYLQNNISRCKHEYKNFCKNTIALYKDLLKMKMSVNVRFYRQLNIGKISHVIRG